MSLKPEWVKGYGRLGAAQLALGRFADALDTYSKGAGLEPSNEAMVEGLKKAREGGDRAMRREEGGVMAEFDNASSISSAAFSTGPKIGGRYMCRHLLGLNSRFNGSDIILTKHEPPFDYFGEIVQDESMWEEFHNPSIVLRVLFHQLYADPVRLEPDSKRKTPVGGVRTLHATFFHNGISVDSTDVTFPEYVWSTVFDLSKAPPNCVPRLRAFVPLPDPDGAVRYWGVDPKSPALRFKDPRISMLSNVRRGSEDAITLLGGGTVSLSADSSLASTESYRPRPIIAASRCAISAVTAEWASR